MNIYGSLGAMGKGTPRKSKAPTAADVLRSQGIARRIRDCVAVLGVSHRELADRAGFTTTSQVSGLLRKLDGGGDVELGTLDKIATASRRSLEWLVTSRESQGVRLGDLREWADAEKDARARFLGLKDPALAAVRESRWPSAPGRVDGAFVAALALAWAHSTPQGER